MRVHRISNSRSGTFRKYVFSIIFLSDAADRTVLILSFQIPQIYIFVCLHFETIR